MKTQNTLLVSSLLAGLVTGSAHAALQGRDLNGSAGSLKLITTRCSISLGWPMLTMPKPLATMQTEKWIGREPMLGRPVLAFLMVVVCMTTGDYPPSGLLTA